MNTNKTKKIVATLLRFTSVAILSVITFLNLLSIFLSYSSVATPQLPQIVFFAHKVFNIISVFVLIWGITLLIKNNTKYLKLFSYFLPSYFIFMTLYRFLYISNYQLNVTDLSNFIIFFIPLGLMFSSYKIFTPDSELDNSQLIDEPFSALQYQGFMARGSANIIDQILILIPLIVVASLTGTWNDSSETYLVVGGVVFLVYLTASEAIWGQTIGKKLSGMRVVMQDGKKCTVSAAILRNSFRIIDMTGGYLLAAIVMAFTSKRQRIGDLMAKTVVIKPNNQSVV